MKKFVLFLISIALLSFSACSAHSKEEVAGLRSYAPAPSAPSPASQISLSIAPTDESNASTDVKLTLVKTYEGFSSPTGVAVDSAENLYVSNWGGGTVTKIDTEGKRSTFVDGLGSPAGLVFDMDGNLYVADYTEDVIYKVNPSGEKMVFAKKLHTPTGISFNKTGDLLVSNRSSDEIVKISSDGKVLPVAQGMKTPVGVAEDADENLFVTNYGGGIIKVTSTGVVENFSSDFGRPGVGIDISANNQIFAADNGDDCVRLLLADGSTKIVIGDIGGCVALLVQGNILYVGSWNSGSVYAYTME